MNHLLQRFWNEEKGSAIIDWCVLGAGASSLGFAVIVALIQA